MTTSKTLHAKKVEILLIIPSLHTGGSERVIIHLVRNLSREKFDITLLVLNREGALQAMIPDDINVVYFSFSRTVRALFSIIKLIRARRPDIVFSTLGHLNLLLATVLFMLPSRTAYVARESSIVSVRNKDERYPRLFNFLFKTVYGRFTRVICQATSMRDDLVKNFGIPEKKIRVINNPVDFSLFPEPRLAFRNGEKLSLISIGQLRREKGYDRLLRMLSQCDFPFEYKIVGGGALEAELKALSVSLGLSDKVIFMGSIPNPYGLLVEADCMLLGSHYEGFPNVVIEANACGIPVLAFRAPGGLAEILQDGVNGWMVETPEEIVALLRRRAFATLDKTEIIRMTRARYELSFIVQQYEKELIAVVRK